MKSRRGDNVNFADARHYARIIIIVITVYARRSQSRIEEGLMTREKSTVDKSVSPPRARRAVCVPFTFDGDQNDER